MNMKKVLGAGVAATIFSIVFGAVTCGGVFSWVYKLEPTNVWKPMSETGPGIEYMLGMLVLTIVWAYIYALIKKSIPGKNKFVKGLFFGLGVWVVGMMPGMLATYTFMTVAPMVIVYWLIVSLVQYPLQGLIVAAIYGD